MLNSLHIRDFAIIDELELAFGPGLNVMTGETGAGKTIIVEAMKLILGERASADIIRSGKERAVVTAVFDASSLPGLLLRTLTDVGVEAGDELIVSRVISEGGRGKITVNGVPVTGGTLKGFAEHLVDVSSQHQHQLLLDQSNHASIVDSFGGNEAFFSAYREVQSGWSAISRELAELKENERAAKEKLDFLKFSLGELKAANLSPGEEFDLESERMRRKHAVTLEERARSAEASLYGDAGSAIEDTGRAIQLVEQCAKIDPSVAPFGETLARARAELEEAARGLARYLEKLESNPARLEEVEEKLYRIKELKRKYGGSVEACLARLSELECEIDRVSRYDEVIAEKSAELQSISKARREAARALSAARKKSAKKLGLVVAGELSGLGMAKVEFGAEVELKPEEGWDESGPDRVEFLFSPNVGEPMRPLARIVSGGELSRVMLAVKGALSGRAELASTSVFDEVDSGIGGAVAEVVGKKLRDVARGRQVICITHLPQVAAQGDRHIRIAKRVEAGRTVAVLESLSDEGRIEEIARMLGGQKITDTTISHAREMLAEATTRIP